jgi:hypothetical protein
MKNKKFIKEDVLNQGSGQFKNEALQKAFAAGCWPKVTGPYIDPISGSEVIYYLSKSASNAANPHMFDFPNGKREWRTAGDKTGKVARTTTWYCEQLNKTKDSILTPDQQKALDRLAEYTSNQVVAWNEGVEKPVGEGWTLVPLSDAITTIENKNSHYADELRKILGRNIGVAKVWVLKGAQQYNANFSNLTVQNFAKNGWKTKEEVMKTNGGIEGFETKDLSDCKKNPDTCKDFQGSYILYKDTGITADIDVIKKLKDAVNDSKISGVGNSRKIACKNALEFYKRAHEVKLEISQTTIDSLIIPIRSCLNSFPKFAKIVQDLQFTPPVQTQTGRDVDYSINPNAGQAVQRENKEKQLKNLVRESLLEIKEKKIKSNLSEGKIVKSRLSIISENVVLKTNKQKDKFCDELLSEMIYLNSQGFNKQVINEGFFDVLKGLFGHAPEGIMEYFKEYMGKWLIEHLTPVDPDGWIGNIIITSVGNLAIGDIPKLTDCNFLTKLISKSVGEGTVRKLTHEQGLDGAFYDVLRNSIVDMLDSTSLVTKIEEGLGGVICPLLGGVKTKMDSATDKLKEKALAK